MMIIKHVVKKVVDDQKEKIGFCKEIMNNAQNRMTLGIIILSAGVGIGGGLIASAYVKLSE